jgi:uncharacterized protein (DUF2336 family)
LWPNLKKWSIGVAKQYRSLENQGAETRKDDILRAAVCAFVALTQPAKRDCNQIEDLALSILPYTSIATKRFVAAALANSNHAPNALVLRLCSEASEICAPLLLMSPVLTPLDLTLIVGTKSRDHARIVSKRQHLPNTVIEALALLDDPVAQARITYGNVSKVAELNAPATANLKPVSAEDARERLREILEMTFAETSNDSSAPEIAANALVSVAENGHQHRLLKLALHDHEGVFVTALADLSGLPFARILQFIRRKSSSELSTLLKAFDVDTNAAFVMCAVFYPSIAANRDEMRLFLSRHSNLDAGKAKDMVRGWKATEISLTLKRRSVNASLPESALIDALDDELEPVQAA